ncbi:positive regulation of interleukin-13 biosynthetic process [Desmophyllum pertusum]|uniref:Positive regulation of interleukin-13 biosynthetic process n=1 Tax=Desmophyllum pertusum TaxID=174260 RepID=A0A9W9Z4T2_9CNID|nr:positive regulation of interleukin-13 biosynthetic process [Desmophyllum pertusum]
MLSKTRVSSGEKDRSFVRRFSSRIPKERQRFTPWLREQIERGNIDGLEWIEKDKGLFKVPWVRVDKPEFVLETHAELFKRWAQHTGKYRQGDQPDPSTWKTRFRCALRKMQEIVEIKERGNLEGSKPYRAFRFKPKLKAEHSRAEIRNRRLSSESLSESNASPEPTPVWNMIDGSIDPWRRMNGRSQYCDDYDLSIVYGPSDQEADYFDFPPSTLQGLNTAMYSEHYALHQFVDWRDLMEPVMPGDWDKYFPGGIQNQYCSLSAAAAANYFGKEENGLTGSFAGLSVVM